MAFRQSLWFKHIFAMKREKKLFFNKMGISLLKNMVFSLGESMFLPYLCIVNKKLNG